MKKTKLTRSLMAACSIVALSAVMYGCVHSGDDPVMDPPDLSMQMDDASAAAMAAATAASDAAAAVAGVASMSTADPASYVEARGYSQLAAQAAAAAAAARRDAAAATTEDEADAALAAAEAAQAAAEAALANAQMYAGMVTAAQTALDEEAARIAAEEEAARIAAEEEAARIAAEEEAARIAAEEEAARIAAEEEAARIAAEEAAAAELVALNTARTAADEAADAAATAGYSAAATVMAIEGIQGSDQSSYDAAATAADAAMAAAAAAREASDAANRATTSAAAAAERDKAAALQTDAETALGHATSYAQMVTEAKAADDAEAERLAAEAAAAEAEMMALATAQGDAQAAHDAAETDKNAAQDAVDAVMDGMDLNASTTAAFERAEAAAAVAYGAYLDAVTANTAAQAAATAADAAPYVQAAQAAQSAAARALAQTQAMTSIVQAAIDAKSEADALAAAEAAEMKALDDAKRLAGEAATAARAAATAADEAATAAEAAAPGSTAATDARNAATAADEAATAAEAANMAAQAATDSGAAMTAQAEAETQQGVAEGRRDVAVSNKNSAEDARAAAERVQEERDLANAKAAAEALYNDAADGVLFHYMAVVGKAADAKTQADNAQGSADRAKAARTDYATANTEAGKAEAASMDAQDSLGRATTAKSDADTARQAAMDATTSDDAKAALEDLKTANAALTEEHTGETGAGMDYMAARDAARDAATASDTHVLELFTMANAYHIETAADPDANLDESELELINKNKMNHVTAVNTAIAATANTQVDVTQNTAMAVWPSLSGAAEGPDGTLGNEDDPEHGSGMITVTVEVGGTEIAMTRAGPGVDEETGTDDDVMANFGDENTSASLADLGGFDMFQLSNRDSGTAVDFTTGVRAIVFTDKMQANERKEAETITVNNVAVTSVSRIGKGEAPTGPGTPSTAADTLYNFAGTYDHDGNSETDPLAGTFICTDPTICSHTRIDDNTATTNVNETEITSISGYKFSGTGTTAAVPSVDDANYITFGFWLDENAPDTTTEGADPRLHRYSFGAFRGGGTQLPNANAVTGTATYEGSAAGVRSTTERVDFFSASATLEADFGADDAGGKITGSIHDIVAGGDDVNDTIYLSLSDIDALPGNASNIDDDGTFDGRAWMGTGTVGDDGEYDRLRTGVWAGAFYSNSVDGTVTAHGSVAGTFGVTDNPIETTEDPYTYIGAFGAHKVD